MHIEIHVPEKYDTEKVFKRLHGELLKAKIPLEGITREAIRTECGTMEGGVMIYGIIYSSGQEKMAGAHETAEKTLRSMGFEVKSKGPLG